MIEPGPGAPRPFPRVPAHAWAWLQRSRPVIVAVAERLTGRPPASGFVDELRSRVETDAFTRDVVIAVVAEVAFGGRVPTRRPPGASWDRGLTWWAAAIAGITPAEFESRSNSTAGRQRELFDSEDTGVAAPPRQSPQPAEDSDRRHLSPVRPPSPPSAERVMVVRALRELLSQSTGGQIPATAVRQLLEQLERL